MPDVRCAFGLVRQGTRPSSLAPSVPRAPDFPQRVAASRPRACGLQPEAVSRFRAPPNSRYRQRSSTSGPVRATRKPSRALLPFRFSLGAFAWSSPSRGGHHPLQPTAPRASCQDLRHRTLAFLQCPASPSPASPPHLGPQAIRHPRAIGLRLAGPSGGSGNHTSFNGRT